VGIEAPWSRPREAWRHTFTGASDRMTIVLSHTPDNAPAVVPFGSPLMLCGHTHGGQIRFPWIGSLIVPSVYGKRFDAGWFQLGSMALYVNRGIGTYAPAIRLDCRPEIARFVFRCGGWDPAD
jgi:predicted MPP superfamily phosphohydrolase